MKIIHISTYEKRGGAAIAAFRLNEAMCRNGIDSRMLVCRVSAHSSKNPYLSNARLIKIKQSFLSRCSRFIQQHYLKSEFVFSLGHCGVSISKQPEVLAADAIYIHWINHNFLSIKEIHRILQLGKPVIIFMHDMWTITGGCHHSFECRNYETACRECPAIHRNLFKNVVSATFKKKERLLSPCKNLHIVTPSLWLSECVKRSSLFGARFSGTISHSIDLNIFKAHNKIESRKTLGLYSEKKYILFAANGGSANPHKGWSFLKEALSFLQVANVEVLILGGEALENSYNGIPIRSMGYFRDEHSLALLYSAVDILVSSSIAETLGLVIMEAIACGTLAVGFNVGGIPDLITSKTGYLVNYKDSSDLATGIKWALTHSDDAELKKTMRQFAEQNFSYDCAVQKHLNLLNRCFQEQLK